MLGSDYDLGIGIAPINLITAGATGLRQYMGNIDYLTVLFVGSAGAVSEPPVLTVKQHTASTAGVTTDFATVSEIFTKGETTLDNDETWARTTQAASATVTGTAQVEQMIAFVLRPEDLTAGNSYISVNVADPGPSATAQMGTVLYILSGFSPRTVPASLAAGLR